jgi:hypothetical protein
MHPVGIILRKNKISLTDLEFACNYICFLTPKKFKKYFLNLKNQRYFMKTRITTSQTIFTIPSILFNAARTKNFIRLICAMILMFAFAVNSNAQTPQYYNYNVINSANSFPFAVTTGKQVQWLLGPGELAQPTPAPSGTLTSLFFFMGTTGTATYTNFTIKLGQTAITTLPTGAFYTGALSTVYFRASVPLTTTASGWLQIILDSTFAYDPLQSLVIDVSQCLYSGTGSTVHQTTLTGFRRSYSVGTCPFIYQGQDGSICHVGANIACVTNMAYGSTNTLQISNGANAPQGSVNTQIIQVPVGMTGCLLPMRINRLAFNTAGTTNPARFECRAWRAWQPTRSRRRAVS